MTFDDDNDNDNDNAPVTNKCPQQAILEDLDDNDNEAELVLEPEMNCQRETEEVFGVFLEELNKEANSDKTNAMINEMSAASLENEEESIPNDDDDDDVDDDAKTNSLQLENDAAMNKEDEE